jgi:hypothetical protein
MKQLIKQKNLLPIEINNKINATTQPEIKATLQEKNLYISFLNSTKIRDYIDKSEEVNKMIDLLMRWRIYTGINADPHFSEYIIIYDFIKYNFGELNYTDIETAINLSTANKLEIIKSKADESFASFSCSYVGRILSAYKEYRKNMIYKVKDQVEKYLLLNAKPEINYDEWIINFQNTIIQAYNQIKLTKNYNNDWGNMVFEFLYKNDYLNFSKSELIKSKKFALEELKKENKKEIKNIRDLATILFSNNQSTKKTTFDESQIIIHQKKYFVIQFFSNLKSIEDIVKNVNKETIQK